MTGPTARQAVKESDMSKAVSPVGQCFDDFLNEQGIAEDVRVEAQLRVLA